MQTNHAPKKHLEIGCWLYLRFINIRVINSIFEPDRRRLVWVHFWKLNANSPIALQVGQINEFGQFLGILSEVDKKLVKRNLHLRNGILWGPQKGLRTLMYSTHL